MRAGQQTQGACILNSRGGIPTNTSQGIPCCIFQKYQLHAISMCAHSKPAPQLMMSCSLHRTLLLPHLSLGILPYPHPTIRASVVYKKLR